MLPTGVYDCRDGDTDRFEMADGDGMFIQPGCSGDLNSTRQTKRVFGYNVKITDMQAAIVLLQLAQFIAVNACVLCGVRE